MRQSTVIESPTGPGVNLIRSSNLALRAMNRSPKTQETYLEAARQFVTFLEDKGMPQSPNGIRREHVEAFLVHLLEDRALASSTVNNRYRGLQAFFKWMLEEGDIPRSPMDLSPQTIGTQLGDGSISVVEWTGRLRQ